MARVDSGPRSRHEGRAREAHVTQPRYELTTVGSRSATLLKRGLKDSRLLAPRLKAWAEKHCDRRAPEYVYVYEIKSDPRFWKIGYTRNLSTRLRTVATSQPFAIEVLAEVPVRNGTGAEYALHCEFAEYWAVGEWFLVDDARYEEARASVAALPGLEMPEPITLKIAGYTF